MERLHSNIEMIKNLFQQIEHRVNKNRKKEKQLLGGLPKIPFIVGLNAKVPDCVNNLISKFVGYQSKAYVQFRIINDVFIPFEWDVNEYPTYFINVIWDRQMDYARTQYLRLKHIRSINSRKDEFTKLPKWVRR